MNAKAEAQEMRILLAKEMAGQCETELALEKQAVVQAANRVTVLEDQVRHLKGELLEMERTRSELLVHVEAIEATEAAVLRERVDDLEGRLRRALADLSQAGRSAANASAATAGAKEEAAEVHRENDVLTQRVERLQSERNGLQEALAALNSKMENAARDSATQISQLQAELSESKSQIQAILAGVAAARDSPKRQ